LPTFNRGYIWRVGTGESINIWAYPWIPSSPDGRVISPRARAIYTKISELIIPITGYWDVQLFNSLFNDECGANSKNSSKSKWF
jgi:hypothetical protein